MASQASRDLQALAAIPGKLEVGPHASALIDELVRAARAGHHLSVIILAAALVDILTHEGQMGLLISMTMWMAKKKRDRPVYVARW